MSLELRYSPRVRELFATLPAAGALATDGRAVVVGEAIALDRGAWVRFEASVAGGRIDAMRLARELDVPAEKMGRLLVVEDAIRSLFERARAIE
jgi:hypothetical protein